MKAYRINEIFYSLQGEGFWSGRSAVFVRFSGCNLKCPFCDTDHADAAAMTAADIVDEIGKYASDFVVLTGGEPSLFMDANLLEVLHEAGKFVAVETNGTHALPRDVDWITLSPKDCFVGNARVVLERADELKLVYDGTNTDAFERYSDFPSAYYFLQPCDTGSKEQNNRILYESIAFCLSHPKWSLSLQMHKIIGVQ